MLLQRTTSEAIAIGKSSQLTAVKMNCCHIVVKSLIFSLKTLYPLFNTHEHNKQMYLLLSLNLFIFIYKSNKSKVIKLVMQQTNIFMAFCEETRHLFI